MSYPKDLDQYDDDHLRAELKRREMARTFGRCDYCQRETSTCDETPCSLPRRKKRLIDDKVEVYRGTFVYGPGSYAPAYRTNALTGPRFFPRYVVKREKDTWKVEVKG